MQKKVCLPYCIIGIIVAVLVILFGRAEDPVAKVHLRRILHQHELYADGPARRVAWVDILEVYDEKKFARDALLISRDWKRANLKEKIVKRTKSEVYYVYVGTDTLEAEKRSNFWKMLGAWVALTIVSSLIFKLSVIFEPKPVC